MNLLLIDAIRCCGCRCRLLLIREESCGVQAGGSREAEGRGSQPGAPPGSCTFPISEGMATVHIHVLLTVLLLLLVWCPGAVTSPACLWPSGARPTLHVFGMRQLSTHKAGCSLPWWLYALRHTNCTSCCCCCCCCALGGVGVQ
jgi:hypothetical protein